MDGSWFEYRSGDTSGGHGCCGIIAIPVALLLLGALVYGGARLIA